MRGEKKNQAVERDEYTTPTSPPDLKVVQVVSDDTRDSENVYMDTASWTPDSKRFAFWHRPSDDGGKRGGLWLCDTEDNFASWPFVEYDKEATIHDFAKRRTAFAGACLAPDGLSAYEILRKEDVVEVYRVPVDGSPRSLVCAAPAPLTIRGCVSMSCDSKHLLMGVWLGDGKAEGAPWGAYIFDVEKGTHWVTEFGNGFRNMHCQYSKNPDAPYDVLVQGSDGKLSDGSWLTPPDGSWRWENMPPAFPPGEGSITAHHVLCDDGSDWRMLPVGNGADITSGGHNGFRGAGDTIFCAVYDLRGGKWRSPIVEVTPIAIDRDDSDYWRGQLAKGVPDPIDLGRKLARADSCHIACDLSGTRFVSDTDGYNVGELSFLWIASYVESDSEDPWLEPAYLALPRSSYKTQSAHAHPNLSPDGKYVVFQSDFTGRPRVNVAYNFE